MPTNKENFIQNVTINKKCYRSEEMLQLCHQQGELYLK